MIHSLQEAATPQNRTQLSRETQKEEEKIQNWGTTEGVPTHRNSAVSRHNGSQKTKEGDEEHEGTPTEKKDGPTAKYVWRKL